MKYFSQFLQSTVATNRLQHQAVEMLNEASGRIVLDVDTYVGELRRRLQILNEANPKCTPLKISCWKGLDGKWMISLDGKINVTFQLFPIKTEPWF